MAIEFTEHDQEILALMTPEHRELMNDIGHEHYKSFGKNVKTSNINKIQSWVGSPEELEEVLFWFKDGKFDDPAWQSLEPCCPECTELWSKAKVHFAQLKKKAINNQKVNDLTLFSAFNTGLLYNGVAPAKKTADGKFCGVEFRVIGSVPGITDSLTIMPVDGGGFEVGFGATSDAGLTGIQVYGGDNYSLLQLAQLIERRLSKIGADVKVKDSAGNEIVLEPRDLRATQANSVTKGWGEFVTLFCSKKVATVDEALQAGDQIVTFFYDRFGLERECINNGRRFGNFSILRDENFDQIIQGTPGKKGLVLLTATLVCRRCRREMKAFNGLAEKFPDVQFCLVNLNSPLSKFYERVFGDMGGGDADEFRKNAAGVTPFTIIYSPNADGVLEYREYYGTEKAEACPEFEHQVELISKYVNND